MNATDAYLAAVHYAATKHRTEHDKLRAAVEVAHQHGLSIRRIAEVVGVNKSTIHRWLQGQPTERK